MTERKGGRLEGWSVGLRWFKRGRKSGFPMRNCGVPREWRKRGNLGPGYELGMSLEN